jgi:hypothetical protein
MFMPGQSYGKITYQKLFLNCCRNDLLIISIKNLHGFKGQFTAVASVTFYVASVMLPISTQKIDLNIIWLSVVIAGIHH